MTTDKSRADALTESAQFLTDVVTADRIAAAPGGIE